MATSPQETTGVQTLQTSTTQLYNLGYMFRADDGTVWQYVKAAAAHTIYDYVKISAAYLTTSATTTTNPSTEPAMVGCCQVAFASGDYGWVVRQGNHTGRFAAACVQDVKIYTTATAGVVDDSATTLINGLKLITTIVDAGNSAALATCLMTTAAA